MLEKAIVGRLPDYMSSGHTPMSVDIVMHNNIH